MNRYEIYNSSFGGNSYVSENIVTAQGETVKLPIVVGLTYTQSNAIYQYLIRLEREFEDKIKLIELAAKVSILEAGKSV